MLGREAGIWASKKDNRKYESADFVNLIERLAVCSGTKWSVSSILDEMLPEQKNLCEARYILEPSLSKRKTFDGKNRKTTNPVDGKYKRNGSVAPLRVSEVRPRSSLRPLQMEASTKQPFIMSTGKTVHTRTNSLRGHVLTLWEDKFRLKCLATEDILFLLTHPSVAITLECASFLRELNINYDEVLELEIALVTLHRQDEWFNANFSVGSTVSICDNLTRNAWIRGRALLASCSSCVVLPEIITSKRVSSRTAVQAKLAHKQAMIPVKMAQSLSVPTPATPATPKLIDCPPEIREFVRDYCREEVTHSVTMKKHFAGEKLSIVVFRYFHKVTHRWFAHWRQQTTWLQCRTQVGRFCRLKCALWVLQRSRKRLECAVFRMWSRWMANVACQCEDEEFAAAVAIQSWNRGVKGKQTAAVHHLHQAATWIQARWRGFHSRRMFKRKKRFVVYNVAARRVQRFYRIYLFRVRCTVWMKQQHAVRVIRRAFVQYIEKKRDFLAWRHHLARYHAAISIQLWMRRTRREIVRTKVKRDREANARRVLFNFFRYSMFIRGFGLRVASVLQRKIAAAVLLQNAYRAKQARARFYELKVRLEDQRRREILSLMWNNAYATTIQKWWRKRKLLQQQQSSGRSRWKDNK